MTVAIDAALLGLGAAGRTRRGRLRIAVPHDSSFGPSIEAAGFETVRLPEVPNTHFSRSIEERIENGRVWRRALEESPVDLLLDLETSAMSFVPDGAANAVAFTHEKAGIPYVAHYIDPITETMQQVDWPTRWQLLENAGWIKWIWDGAHAEELKRLGVPNVLSMSMAAIDGDYPTGPLPVRHDGPAVCFIGHPATSWFQSKSAMPASMRTGLIAAAAESDAPGLKFHEAYFDVYQVDQPPAGSDSAAERARKAADYFHAKFTYNVYLAVKRRDRFVMFLQKALGSKFALIGDHWRECHGITHNPEVFGTKPLQRLIRSAAINLNLYKGNCETGLNQRQFEVTAAGGFLLSHDCEELSRHFEPGRECAVFKGERDLLDKIRHYLAHPAERIEIALAGQRRTLRDHLYSRRLQKLTELVGVNR